MNLILGKVVEDELPEHVPLNGEKALQITSEQTFFVLDLRFYIVDSIGGFDF